MRVKLLILCVLIPLTCCLSCKKVPLTVGKIVTESRELPDFNEVHLNDDISMILVCSDTNYVEITTGENIIGNITTEVIDGILNISNTSTLSWIRPYDYERIAVLHYKDITNFIFASCGTLTSDNQYNNNTLNPNGTYRLEVNGGSGDIDILLNNCKKLNVLYQYGTSRLTLRGDNNHSLNVDKRSYGIFDARDYSTKHVEIRSKSAAHSYIWATESITSNILHHGNIYYKGEPDSIVEEYGPYSEGKLLPL